MYPAHNGLEKKKHAPSGNRGRKTAENCVFTQAEHNVLCLAWVGVVLPELHSVFLFIANPLAMVGKGKRTACRSTGRKKGGHCVFAQPAFALFHSNWSHCTWAKSHKKVWLAKCPEK